MEDITDLLQDANAELKRGRVGVSIQQMRNRLFLRSVLPSKVDGKGATQQRVSTGELATKSGLKRSVNLAHKLATEKKLESFDWSNWLRSAPSEQSRAEVQTESQTVESWVQRFKVDWWDDKTLDTTAQKSQAKRSWYAYEVQFNRISNQKDLLTVDLLVEVAKTTAPGSKPRHEFCQKAKALAKFADLPGIKKLEKVHTKYAAKVPKLPTDEELFAFAEKHRHDGRFGWCFAALVVYGCRVSEVYSLVPSSDGKTASVLTLKQKGFDPKPRTAIALPFGLVERLDLLNVEKPFEINAADGYDSDAAKSQTDMFNKWLQKRWNGSTKLSNKNVRHSWCIRSITEPKFSDALAARSAGHSVAIHTSTYATAIEKRDMEEQAARLAS
ncbi:putative phage integrase [Synechococcus sp. A18-40]|nr:putative phage integrase [Synechococcus sp. A18-40]